MTFTEQQQRAFVDYEVEAWVRLTPHYEDLAGRMTRQVAAATLDAAGVRNGTSVLDVASGPGYVAVAARQRGAQPTGIDFSPDMVVASRAAHPGIRFEQGDAEALPFEDASFDTVICAFGMLHFARPGQALAEAWRVLRPGGRIAFTVWRTPAKGSLFGTIGEAIQKSMVVPAEMPTGPSPYMLGDPMVCTAIMDAARFTGLRIDDAPLTFDLKASSEVFEFLLKCSPRGAYIYRQQPAEARARIEQALLDEGARAMAADGRLPCPALVVSGTKAGG